MTRPINEQDEFLLSRLLDDDLSSDEAASLRVRLEREPELQRAFVAMSRLDTLLVARRADQPQVNWASFHSQVMNRVEAEAARPITIKLASYLRAALPLAAAAAIALVIWYWPHGQTPLPLNHDSTQGTEIAQAPVTEIRIAGQSTSTGNDDEIHVAFARSDDLSKQYKAEDEQSRQKQSSGTYMRMGKEAPPAGTSSPGLLAEVSALMN
jgi:hypothetical protein